MIVLLTLLVLAPLFSDLPKPVLAALIIEAVVMGMMDVPEMRRLARVQRFDFWIAIAAIAGTLLFGVLAGVMIGIGLSLVWLISVATRPPMPLLGREPGTQVFRELDEHPEDEQFPGVVVLRLDGGLFFATSDALEDRVREVALVDARHHRDRARLRGHRLHRLAGLGEDARDPRAHRSGRGDPAPGPGEARRSASCSGATASSIASVTTGSTATSIKRSRLRLPRADAYLTLRSDRCV